ncbi:MAG: endonuclease/exonuclease/phosphatase family protein [Bacteroidota bacterium]
MIRSLALVVSLLATSCSGGSSGLGTEAGTPPPFRVQESVEWRTEGVRIAAFNAEFLFDGEGNEGDEVISFPWKGDPAKARAHRDDIARSIRRVDADVVLLTEAENLGVLEMMIEESLGDMGYRAFLVDGQDSFTGQDVGLLSRIPVENVGRTNERIPVGVGDRTYGVSKNMWARMTIRGVPVTIVGLHFLARPLDAERAPRREAQAEVIRRLVEAEMRQGREVVVLGDFNDFEPDALDRAGSRPVTDVLATIKRAGPGPEDDLLNVLGEVPQAERFTALYDRNRNDVIEEGELSAIDHILLSPGLYGRLREVVYAHVHDPREVSDHFPLAVSLALE